MRTLTLIIGLSLSISGFTQELKGFENYLRVDDVTTLNKTGQYFTILEFYQFEINSYELIIASDIEIVLNELSRVLILNNSSLEKYTETIPPGMDFTSFNPLELEVELSTGLYVGYKYVLGEFSIYLYSFEMIDGQFVVGFNTGKTNEY